MNLNIEKKLFLIDAYALIYRSYYAFIKNPMYNLNKFNTSTIYGFFSTLEEIIRNQKPTHIAIAFDSHGPTFRHTIYPEYKANRLETPENIRESDPYIKRIIGSLNIKLFEKVGFEADDIIGTISKFAEKQDFKIYMVTSDKDYGQLVSENIFIYKPKKSGNDSEIINVQKILKKYEIKNPNQVIDILALWGDSTDNIPGVSGIGEKTASKLISKYDTIDNLLKNINDLTGKLKTSILESSETIYQNRNLAKIDCQVPIDIKLDDLRLKSYNEIELTSIFKELNFKNLLERFIRNKNTVEFSKSYSQGTLFHFDDNIKTEENKIYSNNLKKITDITPNYILINNDDLLGKLIEEIKQQGEFCFDTETTGLDTHKDDLVGIAFCWTKGTAYYLAVPENNATKVLSRLVPVFEDEKINKIGHNLKFDVLFLNRYGIKVKGNFFDTMIAHYLIEPEQSHKMDVLSEKYLKYKTISIEELIGKKGSGQLKMSQVDVKTICEYSCEDADVTFQLREILEKEINKFNFGNLFYNIEIPLLKVLIEIEKNGVVIDLEILKDIAASLRSEINTTETEIYIIAGERFNISSPKQLGNILFNKLNIPSSKKLTKSNQFSTSEETLLELVDKHTIIKKILDFRSLSKLLSTYVEALPKLINPITGRIHTNFNQTITATGRLSSNNPNLQNIPIKDTKGKEIRRAFVSPGSNYVILSADYSQIELRIMAHMSGDENMINAFLGNEDIHIATAAKIFNIPSGKVTKEQRNKAKIANFGIIYGISTFGLSQRLHISKRESQELIEGYFKNFPGVKTYMNISIENTRVKGYNETILGRRRYLPDITSKNSFVRSMAERNAINSPIQGSAADIIKIAMVNISNTITKNKLKTKMVLQVHDELIFYVPFNELDESKKLIRYEMENAILLKVPLLVDIGIGNNWLEAH